MGYNKGLHSSSGGNQRARLYAFILMFAFGAVLLGAMTMMLHKLRERRIYNLVVKDKGRQRLTLQLLLQKERYHSKEIERKNSETKAKIDALRGQKMELDRKVLKMKSTMNSLKDEQKVMESAFEEAQNEIRMLLEGRGSNLGKGSVEEAIALTQNLMQKEAEIRELKQRLGIPVNDPNIFPENLTANGTMAAQMENPRDSTIYGNVTNEDISKSELNKFKDGKVIDEIQDVKGNSGRLIETYEQGQMRRNWLEGTSGGGSATNKEITDENPQDDGDAGVTAKYLNGKENKSIKEEQPRQVENYVHDGGAARKHGHVTRKTWKQWRMNGMNMQAKKLKLDEIIELEKQEGNFFQQNWSGRHINKGDSNAAQAKDNMFHQQTEKLQAVDVQKDEGDIDDEDNDDSFKESQSDFEDEKMEYKDEIYELEFQGGL